MSVINFDGGDFSQARVRRANVGDIPAIMHLLRQVNKVHSDLRADIFKTATTKYAAADLEKMLTDPLTPIFVYDADPASNMVLGYVFGQILTVKDDLCLRDRKTLYIDDICVEAECRGRHIGEQLFLFVTQYAKEAGCDDITLNVWEGNDRAMAFYQKMGMRVRKTYMELTF